MTSLDAAHEDVAAYALNLMEPEEAWRFELHLLTCEQCTIALAELTPVADRLSQVDAGELLAANRIFRDGRVLDGMLETAAKQRGRTRALRLVSVAAGVVALVIISVLTVAISGGGIWPGDRPAGTDVARTPDDTTQNPQSTGGASGGLEQTKPGACDGSAAAQTFTAIDPVSGISGKVTVSCATWGTPVIVTLSNIVGPKRCELVIRTKGGKDIVTSSWTVAPGGFGTPEQPQPAIFQTQTDELLPQIAAIVIREIPQGGGQPQPLVTVSTNR